MEEHEKYMKITLREAEKAASQGEVPVACLILDENKEIISIERNSTEKNAVSIYHAEILAIEKALLIKKSKTRLKYCTLYTNLEPCIMCFGAILNARISQLVYASYDYNEGAINGQNKLIKPESKKLEIISGLCKEESEVLIKTFFKKLRKKREK